MDTLPSADLTCCSSVSETAIGSCVYRTSAVFPELSRTTTRIAGFTREGVGEAITTGVLDTGVAVAATGAGVTMIGVGITLTGSGPLITGFVTNCGAVVVVVAGRGTAAVFGNLIQLSMRRSMLMHLSGV